MGNNIDHPSHYGSRHVGYECISLAGAQSFCIGNLIKYLWRYPYKAHPSDDLKKARWYARLAASRHELTYTADTCGIILRKLARSSDGLERVAWNGIHTSDWHTVIETLDRMIKEKTTC